MSAYVPTGRDWAIALLARVQSERVGAFVPNPAGKAQRPTPYAVECALVALNVQSIDDAMANPAMAARINALVARHA